MEDVNILVLEIASSQKPSFLKHNSYFIEKGLGI